MVKECETKGVQGKDVTPYILERVNQLTAGKSLEANKSLIENNASVGASIAVELAKLRSKGASMTPQNTSENRVSFFLKLSFFIFTI